MAEPETKVVQRPWWRSPTIEYLTYALVVVLVLVAIETSGSLRVWHVLVLAAVAARVVFLILRRRRISAGKAKAASALIAILIAAAVVVLALSGGGTSSSSSASSTKEWLDAKAGPIIHGFGTSEARFTQAVHAAQTPTQTAAAFATYGNELGQQSQRVATSDPPPQCVHTQQTILRFLADTRAIIARVSTPEAAGSVAELTSVSRDLQARSRAFIREVGGPSATYLTPLSC